MPCESQHWAATADVTILNTTVAVIAAVIVIIVIIIIRGGGVLFLLPALLLLLLLCVVVPIPSLLLLLFIFIHPLQHRAADRRLREQLNLGKRCWVDERRIRLLI